MKKQIILTLMSFCLVFISCKKESFPPPKIEGLTLENYPKVDGSTSTDPLNKIIASRLLGYKYRWQTYDNELRFLVTDLSDEFVIERLKPSQTHQSIINLIDKKADLILSARKMSPTEKAHADNAGVTLIETPIALDAFVVVANLANPVKSLTTQQLKDIYTGKIKTWKEVGGNDKAIKPYTRNPDSGSQELMESLVMQGLQIADFDIEYSPELPSMFSVFSSLRDNPDGVCYTVYYYKEYMISGQIVKSLAIDGITANKNTIKNRTYPYVAEVYATIRSDLDRNSMAYKLYEWLQTEEGKKVINESGYVAN